MHDVVIEERSSRLHSWDFNLELTIQSASATSSTHYDAVFYGSSPLVPRVRGLKLCLWHGLKFWLDFLLNKLSCFSVSEELKMAVNPSRSRYTLAKINTQRFPAQTWDRHLCKHFMNESNPQLMPLMIHDESCRSVILFRMWDIYVCVCVTATEAKLAMWDAINDCHGSRTRCDSSAGIWLPGRLLQDSKFSALGFTRCQPHFSV